MKRRVAFVSVVPSPYQRDLFAALSRKPEVELRVFYLEAESPDSPWPRKPLADYEEILRGTWFPLGSARVHLNVPPDLRGFDLIVMNSLMSVTAQWLMRRKLLGKRWLFWGERLGRGGSLHTRLTEPLHRAAGIAAVGTVAERDYQARFPEPRTFCIPYYCDLAPFLAAPRPAKAQDEVVFLFCGQMIARKGVDVLLEAFSRLKRARLLLVGREGELPGLLANFSPEIKARVQYAGFQSPENLPQFFAQADVFVLPSRSDGWGVVVNQALGAGLPIVCSDMAGAAHDLVDEEVNGVIFPSGNVDALAAALQMFVADSKRIEQWGAASRKKAEAWLPEVGATKWVEAFEAVTRA